MEHVTGFDVRAYVDRGSAPGYRTYVDPLVAIFRYFQLGRLYLWSDLEHVKIRSLYVNKHIVSKSKRKHTAAAQGCVIDVSGFVVITWAECIFWIAVFRIGVGL